MSLLNRADVKAMFGITTQTIIRWEKEGILNPIKLNNRRVYYRPSDIEKTLKANQSSIN